MDDLEAPKSSQEPLKSSQKEPERTPKRFQNHLWIENDDFPKIKLPFIKSTFVRVGGSVWELKIDRKRLREEIKNDIEKRRKKKYFKKSIKSDKTAPGSNGVKDF